MSISISNLFSHQQCQLSDSQPSKNWVQKGPTCTTQSSRTWRINSSKHWEYNSLAMGNDMIFSGSFDPPIGRVLQPLLAGSLGPQNGYTVEVTELLVKSHWNAIEIPIGNSHSVIHLTKGWWKTHPFVRLRRFRWISSGLLQDFKGSTAFTFHMCHMIFQVTQDKTGHQGYVK